MFRTGPDGLRWCDCGSVRASSGSIVWCHGISRSLHSLPALIQKSELQLFKYIQMSSHVVILWICYDINQELPKYAQINVHKPKESQLSIFLKLGQATSSRTSWDSSKTSRGQWQILDRYLGNLATMKTSKMCRRYQNAIWYLEISGISGWRNASKISDRKPANKKL